MSIKDCIQKLSLEDTKNKVPSYDYGLIYYMSSMVFDRISNIYDIDWEECLEAYFFNEKGQLHIYREDDVLTAREFVETENLTVVEKKYELANSFKGLGSSVVVREYLEPDEDGQMYVAYKRMSAVALGKEEQNG